MVSRATSLMVFGLAAIFFGLFFFLPVFITVRDAFFRNGEFSVVYLTEVFRHPLYLEGWLNALKIGLLSTLLAMAIAVPLALMTDRYVFPGKRLLSALILVPLILPPFVGALGVKQFLGKMGSLNAVLMEFGWASASDPVDWLGENRLLGIVLMNALHLYPIVYLNLTAALANLDPAMEEAAQNLGCGSWKRFWRITFPLAAPGLFAGATLVFIWSFTELGVPLIFDYTRVTSVQIFDGLKDLSGNPMPYALVVVMLLSAVLVFGTSRLILGKVDYASSGRASQGRSERRIPLVLQLVCTLVMIGITCMAILPHIGVILMSLASDWYGTLVPGEWTLAHYEEALGHPLTLLSIQNSLLYASCATVMDLVVGVALAFVIVRSSFKGRYLLDAAAMLPLAVPGIVLAFGYLAMTREGQWFDFLVPDGNPTFILIIAYAVRRLPYVVRSAVAGFQQTSPTYEEAAQNLGASPFKALRLITLPLISANLIAGGLLAFSFAMLEVSDSLILAAKQAHFPITTAMYSLFNALGNGENLASALGVWAMVLLGVTLVGASVILGRKMGLLFRV